MASQPPRGNPTSIYGLANTDFYAQINTETPFNSDFGANGRVFFDMKKPAPQYDLYTNSSKKQTNYTNTLTYTQEETPLSQLFFSQENIDRVQSDIKRVVYESCERDRDPILTKFKPIVIGRQNDLQLQIIMRSIFLQFSKNVEYNVAGQIHELNDLVVREAVPDIITNIKQYIGYSADIERLPIPMDLPKNPSSKGEKTYSLLIV